MPQNSLQKIKILNIWACPRLDHSSIKQKIHQKRGRAFRSKSSQPVAPKCRGYGLLWAFRCNPSRRLGFQSKIFDTIDTQITVVDISTKVHHTQSPYQKRHQN